MNLVVCLDESFGMTFNNRRLSSDKYVIDDILKFVCEDKLALSLYSAELFSDSFENLVLADNLPDDSFEGFYFVENINLSGQLSRFSKIIIYKWNRRYPSDLKFPKVELDNMFKLVDTVRFEGKSHSEITREVYISEKN